MHYILCIHFVYSITYLSFYTQIVNILRGADIIREYVTYRAPMQGKLYTCKIPTTQNVVHNCDAKTA